MLEDLLVGFIGGGNMAEAVIRGLVSAGKDPRTILVSDVRSERLELLYNLGAATSTSNRHVASRAQVLVLAVKPQVLPDILPELAPALDRDTLIVSIAAGIPTASVEKAFDFPARVVRVMPNTPLLAGAGVSALVKGAHASDEDLALAEEIFSASGKTVRLQDEGLMDAVTAVSGSGPAYVFYLAEAMLEAALEEGLPPETAEVLVRETIRGSGVLLCSQPDTPPEELRRRVTSPGGTTQAAVEVLDSAGAKDVLRKAVRRAAERSRELGRS